MHINPWDIFIALNGATLVSYILKQVWLFFAEPWSVKFQKNLKNLTDNEEMSNKLAKLIADGSITSEDAAKIKTIREESLKNSLTKVIPKIEYHTNRSKDILMGIFVLLFTVAYIVWLLGLSKGWSSSATILWFVISMLLLTTLVIIESCCRAYSRKNSKGLIENIAKGIISRQDCESSHSANSGPEEGNVSPISGEERQS